ncbi:MAG: ribokinase [Cardiobacteriaceae bacterium]|nr:ribokinase [Cardiobacteriaceae bacterium]
MKPLLVLGSSNIDHIAQMAEFPKVGQTLMGSHYHRAFGGKGANQAVAAAKLGATVKFISAFGDDSNGSDLRKQLTALGIDCSGSKNISGPTGIAMIWLNNRGENSIVVIAGANEALDASHVEEQQANISHADTLLMQLETPLEGIISAAAIARRSGVRTILNPAPAQTLPAELLANIDIITPNETEAEILSGISVHDEKSAASAAIVLHQQGIKTVLTTLGAQGVYSSEQGAGRFHPAFCVNAIDTTAAGDTFNGGFATALMQRHSLNDAIVYGQAAAALSVQKMGAQPSIPSAEETLNFMKQH